MEPANQAAAHLSPIAQRFLDYITSNPELTRHLDHIAAGERNSPVQSWPTFVGEEKLAEIRRVTIELTRLAKSVPERFFGNDPRRIAAYYGLPSETPTALAVAPPNGLDSVLVRNDYIDTPDGFKCLEVNAGMIGGWEHRYFEQRVRAHPVIARFLEMERVTPHHRDSLAVMLRFIIDHNLGKPVAASGVLNVAITMRGDRTSRPGEDARLSRTYRDLLEASGTGLEGEVTVCSCADLAARQSQIWYRDRRPIQALVQMSGEALPGAAFRAFKVGRLSLYNAPIAGLLNDKRSLTLLSEHADSAVFTAEERDFLQRHMPWTRTVGPGAATYRGVTRALPELLLDHREELVLKPSYGCRGQEVAVGHLTPPDRWARLVQEAVARGDWLAQERVDSRPYIYQHGEQGYGVYDVVWGTFCFGATYGGGFLSMVLRGAGDGVINASRGAIEGILFEV